MAARVSRDSARPFFLWVHYIDPHGPYDPPADRPTDFTHAEALPINVERVPGYVRVEGVDDGWEYVDLYDEEIAYMDREVGRLLRVYERLGLADQSLAIFSADHGESMMEHENWFTHGYQVYEEIVHVPLALRGPGLRSERIHHPVSLADLAPTMLEVASLATPAGMYGLSLSKNEPGRQIFAEATWGTGQWRSMWIGAQKWTIQVEQTRTLVDRALGRIIDWQPFVGSAVVRRRYYDLGADPEELAPYAWPGNDVPQALIDLVGQDPDPAGRPRWALRGDSLDGPKVAPGLDPEILDRLRALGYVR